MDHSLSKLTRSVEFAPLRTLSDFLLESARFQIPDFRDQTRWANRIRNNLLYYQTNYFLMIFLIYLIFLLIYPVKVITGICTITALYYFRYCTQLWTIHDHIVSLRKHHPIINLFILLAGWYTLKDVMKEILDFLIGVQFPIILFLHSSLRLRNIKNKIANQLESIGLKKTPVGVFLEAYGLN
ncbi:PRA1 family protein 3-like isoform X2 [Centruroides vittatus]|uniref:PRA1 family protein 3-like isoform X2 n=1 Tax=Centruroides vittatus TaxID=120091 RepID=UPI0035109B0C